MYVYRLAHMSTVPIDKVRRGHQVEVELEAVVVHWLWVLGVELAQVLYHSIIRFQPQGHLFSIPLPRIIIIILYTNSLRFVY